MNWIALTTEDQLEAIHQQSFSNENRGVLIFKHSTRCSISSMALNRLERSWDISAENLPIYYLDLLKYKPLSAEIAAKYGIEHQSPQLLIIKNGACVYTASHSEISSEAIHTQINL